MSVIFFATVAFLLFGLDAFAKDYPYFITEDINVHVAQDGRRIVEPFKIDEAKHAKDSRPAAQDPEGHWGVVSNGIQASIRFETTSFAINDPIIATVIMRNVGEEWRMFETKPGLASCILVINPHQKMLERKDFADPKTRLGWLQRHQGGLVATL